MSCSGIETTVQLGDASGVVGAFRRNRYRLRRAGGLALLFSVLALTLFGIVMLYSTSSATEGERLLLKQVRWILMGLVGGGVMYLLDYRWLCRRRGRLLLVVALPLAYLAAAHILWLAGRRDVVEAMPLVHGVNGAFRWLFVGPVSIQASEFTKLALVVFMAGYYGSHPRWAPQFVRGVVKPFIIIGGVLMLLLLGGSLSLTMITGAMVLGVWFVAGGRLRYFVIMGLLSALLIGIVLNLSTERLVRVTNSWLHPEEHRRTTGYQLYHSQLALGSGGSTGLGFNRSRMKERYLPEVHTDFILAIVGEELGYVGMLAVMSCYLLLFGAGCVLSMTAVDRQGTLLGVGICLGLALQAVINIGVVSGALPTTGVTAPLISYGGSSVLVTWLGVGLLGSIARVAWNEELTADSLSERVALSAEAMAACEEASADE
jgi:cell division protein FtsW